MPLESGLCFKSSPAVSPGALGRIGYGLLMVAILYSRATNDAIGYGELVKVERGQLVRQFLRDEQDPSADVNVGRLPEEPQQGLVDWADAAKWVDEDDEFSLGSDRGLLWIHKEAG